MIQFNSTPNPILNDQEKVSFRQEYTIRFTKLQMSAFKQELKGIATGITCSVSSIVAGFWTMKIVRNITGSIGESVLGLLAVSVIGVSTSIIYAIWVDHQKTIYNNQLVALNVTMNDEYIERHNNKPFKQI